MKPRLITGADLGTDGLCDIAIDKGSIAAIASNLSAARGVDVIDAKGAGVIPGLHDHHIHLRATAAALDSVQVGPPSVIDAQGFAAALVAAHRALPKDQWLRAVGYHDSVAGTLDRWALDAIVSERPVRVQHRSGALWIVNSQGVERARIDAIDDPGVERDGTGRATGRLMRLDRQLTVALGSVDVDLRAVSEAAASFGVVGFTDATPQMTDDDVDFFAQSRKSGSLTQHITAMAEVSTSSRQAMSVSIGAVKIMLDDGALVDFDRLTAMISSAHHSQRPVAVHCVTRVQCVVAIAAFAEAGALGGDRIEHGAVIPDELLVTLRDLGITVVTNPAFVYERGDQYLKEVDGDDLALLYRCRSLAQAEVALAAGTDAPFGPLDPWIAVRAAVERRTRTGATLGASERIAAHDALGLFLGTAVAPDRLRTIAVGQPADLCVLAAPLHVALEELSSSLIAATVIAGEVVYTSSER